MSALPWSPPYRLDPDLLRSTLGDPAAHGELVGFVEWSASSSQSANQGVFRAWLPKPTHLLGLFPTLQEARAAIEAVYHDREAARVERLMGRLSPWERGRR